MPRHSRVDAPGAIQHVMLRGIEKRRIFHDDRDRADFVNRLGHLGPELGFRFFAWALMPNHAHLALQTGPVGLSLLMARLGTGYARAFNLRHRRVGHLMQGRFKSRLVNEERDLAGLVIYVHSNPLRAGLVPDAKSLEDFDWCGHGSLMGLHRARPFESCALTLELFSDDARLARARIRHLIGKQEEGDRCESDLIHAEESEREHVKRLFSPATQHEIATIVSHRSLDHLIERVCRRLGAEQAEVRAGRRGRLSCTARQEIAYGAIQSLGIRAVRVSEALGVSESAISRAVDRVRKIRGSPSS